MWTCRRLKSQTARRKQQLSRKPFWNQPVFIMLLVYRKEKLYFQMAKPLGQSLWARWKPWHCCALAHTLPACSLDQCELNSLLGKNFLSLLAGCLYFMLLYFCYWWGWQRDALITLIFKIKFNSQWSAVPLYTKVIINTGHCESSQKSVRRKVLWWEISC